MRVMQACMHAYCCIQIFIHLLPYYPGWTIFDNLFFYEGTLFVVTDNATKIPDTKYMISVGLNIENGAEAEAARLPSEKEMRVVSRKEAQKILGKDAQIIDGVTVSSRKGAGVVRLDMN
jgi:hypothetical protein